MIYMPGYCDECGGRDCDDVNCELIRRSSCLVPCPDCGDHVHAHHDGFQITLWYFWDVESPPVEHGPFLSEYEARAAAASYLEWP